MKIQSQQSAGTVAAPPAPRAPSPRAEAPPPPATIIREAQDDLLRAAQALRDALGPHFRTEPRFSMDQETNRVRIEIVDDSGEVVRQIPTEDVERFTRTFDILIGLLVDESV